MKHQRTITQTFSIPLDIVERLDALAHRERKPRSRLVREAILILLEEYAEEVVSRNVEPEVSIGIPTVSDEQI